MILEFLFDLMVLGLEKIDHRPTVGPVSEGITLVFRIMEMLIGYNLIHYLPSGIVFVSLFLVRGIKILD